MSAGFEFLPFGDSAALRTKFEEAGNRKAQYAAFIVEPIQGEGGRPRRNLLGGPSLPAYQPNVPIQASLSLLRGIYVR